MCVKPQRNLIIIPLMQIWILNHQWACGGSKASLSVRQHLEREMERMVNLTCSDFAPEINVPCSSAPLAIKTIPSDRLMTVCLSSLVPCLPLPLLLVEKVQNTFGCSFVYPRLTCWLSLIWVGLRVIAPLPSCLPAARKTPVP